MSKGGHGRASLSWSAVVAVCSDPCGKSDESTSRYSWCGRVALAVMKTAPQHELRELPLLHSRIPTRD